jgi:hypothetical protein
METVDEVGSRQERKIYFCEPVSVVEFVVFIGFFRDRVGR